MLLELLIAGHLNTYIPPEPEVKQETQIVQVIEEEPVEETAPAPEPTPPPEPTLEEKIATNYYQCNTDTHFIRADNAHCLPKPVSKPQTTTKARVQAPRASQGYYYQCAGWVASKRYVPQGWGNASNWKNAATKAGWTISSTPVAGAIGWTYGHVVFVEAVHNNGTVTISEQNYDWRNSVRTITVPTSKYTYLY